MTPDEIGVTIGGFALAAFVAWFFWMKKPVGTRVAVTSSGYQEAMILVKGGYSPDVIVVEQGKPVRLSFRREETAGCSDTVVFPDFAKSAKLPTGEVVPVELMPDRPGEYEFTCAMGMLKGKLIVE